MIPEFPKTPHLHQIDASILSSPHLFVEEKVDGANCGMARIDGHPVIRNRTHVLNKGYIKKNTPAKLQFRPVWNWYYQNAKKFKRLSNEYGPVALYGEWLWALHGIHYDELPDWFIVYDMYDLSNRHYIAPNFRREILDHYGFANIPLLHTGPITLEELQKLCQQPSAYSSSDQCEGVYLKVGNDTVTTDRCKLIREGYTQGCNWDDEKIAKQQLKLR